MRRNGKMVRNIGLIMYAAMIVVFLIVYLSVNNTSTKHKKLFLSLKKIIV